MLPTQKPAPAARRGRLSDLETGLEVGAAPLQLAGASCPVGHVVVVVRERKIVTVMLGDDPATLDAMAQTQFAGQRWSAADDLTARYLAGAVAAAAAEPLPEVLPLSPEGTAFQQRVWGALAKTARGQTLTYGHLAAQVGVAGGARAVAGACAANRIALLVPCHRIVRNDGGLGGYRWGVERKRQLLAHEAAGLRRA